MCSDEVMEYGKDLQGYARSLGSDIYGVASATAYEQQFPDKPSPKRFLPDAQSVIVVGLPFTVNTYDSVIRPDLTGLHRRAAEEVTSKGSIQGAERYFVTEELAILDREIRMIAYRVARRLEGDGFKAFHLPPCKADSRWLTPPFSHMPALYLAGLGTMGMNCSILHPRFGPRMWVTSVITEKALPYGSPLDEEVCDDCMESVAACPVQALDGQGWKDIFKCEVYGCCGTCQAVCPIGRPEW
jgi:epoxyqueuosine reductase QueG